MDYLSALNLVHTIVAPKNYCEIGCRFGNSLTLSKSPAVGIDPDFEIKAAFAAPTRLFRMTSDDFFATRDIRAILGGPIDFAFIDGLHQVEFALRDFMNLERNSHPAGVITIDDLLPGDMAYATRDRNTQIWTGDVYRIVPILREYRPDLEMKIYDVEMKGFCTITNLDPSSTVLRDRYPEIAAGIAAGKWQLPSVEAIRAELAPQPVELLAQDLARFAERRNASQPPAAAAPAAQTGERNAELYLSLLKRSILNEIYLDDELRILYLRACLAGIQQFDPAVLHDIRDLRRDEYNRLAASRSVGQFFDRNIHNSGFNHSMMGRARLDSLQQCLDIVRRENIPGDFMECGVWRGGGCIFMSGYAQAYGLTGRRIFAADSFEGLPVPSSPADAGLDLSKAAYPELAVSLENVKENFAVYGLGGPNVHYLKGWFKDTLPGAPVSEIALLRMDGDLYESTMDILVNVYDKVVPGGIVIVDDYGAVEACRRAVDAFFASRDLPSPQLEKIDWTGVWFRKAR